MPVFELLSSDGKPQKCELAERDVTIGRDGANDIVLALSEVSRFHAAVILTEQGEYVLRDLGSSNGVYVNGAKTHRHVLEPGDQIQIATETLSFVGSSRRPRGKASAEFSMPQGRDEGKDATPTACTPPATHRLATSSGALGLKAGSLDNEQLLETLKCAQLIASAAGITPMLSRLLDNSLAYLNAERGFILLSEKDKLVCKCARPEQPRAELMSGQWSAAVYEAIDTRSPVVTDGKSAGDDDLLCMPLVASGNAIGVVGVGGRFRERSSIAGLKVATALCGLCAAHVENAKEHAHLKQQCAQLHEAVQAKHRFVGSSPALKEVYAGINQAAKADYPLLITGETGTGKDLVARAVHQLSARADAPFAPCNCAAIPENLLETEMFGYAPHSGISYSNPQGKAGTFEFADGGTIFLDEIGDFSTAMQAKLLRVLEDGCVQRVGSNDIIEVDVRVVAATNKDIRAMIDEGTFRADLYHRINCLQIALPPLRDRESDILLLAAHFLEQHVSPPLREKLHITHETARVLTSYPWPGNVRELRNAILRASLSATGAKLEPEHLLPEITGYLDEPGVIRTLIQVEKEHIQTVLRAANGNKRKAAELLDISPQTLYNKMKEYNVGVRDTTVG